MSKGNERFSAAAAAWDTNPDVHRASDSALQAILRVRPDLAATTGTGAATEAGVDVLEIGCGTGLLTLRLVPYVRSIVAVDAASGMIDVLRSKLARAEPAVQAAVTPVCALLTDPEDPALPPARAAAAAAETDASGDPLTAPRRKFDLAISHLVLHHIADLSGLLRTLYGCLRPGGQVALTDYEDFGPAARRFHAEAKMEGVERHGIPAAWFAGLMRDAGFVDVLVQPAWTMEKNVERYPGEWNNGKPTGVPLETMDFPFLLCRGTKPTTTA
ncbi:methyltransferase type 11 [Niveomyces insectorum RCEF 264]|uniref:Methyltransferase type 11 n=1 Tax=Niveomyces insectorum RCEF 264 TaxID=1081102 RepID=A0A162IF41_9HYPO|nr:methyltransferase type 11 [Niveomyces insectorum RCEF 264]